MGDGRGHYIIIYSKLEQIKMLNINNLVMIGHLHLYAYNNIITHTFFEKAPILLRFDLNCSLASIPHTSPLPRLAHSHLHGKAAAYVDIPLTRKINSLL